MRGYVEESGEVKAKRELRRFARRYAAAELNGDVIGRDIDVAGEALEAAALRYAAASSVPKRRAAASAKGVGR